MRRRSLNLGILLVVLLMLALVSAPLNVAAQDDDSGDPTEEAPQDDDTSNGETSDDTNGGDDAQDDMDDEMDDEDMSDDDDDSSDTPPPSNTGAITHVVQPGDNLFRISLRYGVTVRSIANANGIANPNLIIVGQNLSIPGGVDGGQQGPNQPPLTGGGGETTTHTVTDGDNLYRLSIRYNTTVQAIANANSISNPNLIFIGDVLQIPVGSGDGNNNNGGGNNNNNNGGGNTGGGGVVVPVEDFEIGGHVASFSDDAISAMQSASMTWAKTQITYTPGMSTDVTAEAINNSHTNGFKSLLSFVGRAEDIEAAGLEQYTDDFAEFLADVATQNPFAIEVWNEPNLDRDWPTGEVSPQAYTEMLQKAYEAIKEANEDVMVISGALAPTGAAGPAGSTDAFWNDDAFLQGMNQAGAAQFMDCVGAHYNAGAVAPNARSGAPVGSPQHYSWYFLPMLELYANAFNGQVPVCWTELGYLTFEDFDEDLPAGFDWADGTSVAEHAVWLGEAATLSRNSNDVMLMIVWNVNFESTTPDPTGGYAIIRPDGECPACDDLANAVQ